MPATPGNLVTCAPGWQPGLGLPGLPGGTPFYVPLPGSVPAVITVPGGAAVGGAGTAAATAIISIAAALTGSGAAAAARNVLATVDISAEPQATGYARIQPPAASQQAAAVGASQPAGAAVSPAAFTIQVGNVTQNRV